MHFVRVCVCMSEEDPSIMLTSSHKIYENDKLFAHKIVSADTQKFMLLIFAYMFAYFMKDIILFSFIFWFMIQDRYYS